MAMRLRHLLPYSSPVDEAVDVVFENHIDFILHLLLLRERYKVRRLLHVFLMGNT